MNIAKKIIVVLLSTVLLLITMVLVYLVVTIFRAQNVNPFLGKWERVNSASLYEGFVHGKREYRWTPTSLVSITFGEDSVYIESVVDDTVKRRMKPYKADDSTICIDKELYYWSFGGGENIELRSTEMHETIDCHFLDVFTKKID